MINEPSSYASGQSVGPELEPSSAQTPGQDAAIAEQSQLRAIVGEVMQITEVDGNPPPPMVIRLTGTLLTESAEAFAHVDKRFEHYDYHAVLTTDEQERSVFMALRGRVRPKPRPWWPNLLLLGLTALSLLYAGAVHEAGLRNAESVQLMQGWPYALAMVLILGAHELGHYFAGRYHKVSVTLPYFIPAPVGFGTLGAFIQLREPMPNRRVLFDVGIAGPLAGLVMAIPILFIGLATSDLQPLPEESYVLEGDSLAYVGAKLLLFGKILPDGTEDVFINQLAKAGWTGLFITGLNLIPLGQLDGGHILSTLFGSSRAQRLYLPIVGVFFVLSLFNSAWLLWTMLLLLLGRVYATPLDNITELDQRRRWLGYIAIGIFILVFVPNPLQVIQP